MTQASLSSAAAAAAAAAAASSPDAPSDLPGDVRGALDHALATLGDDADKADLVSLLTAIRDGLDQGRDPGKAHLIDEIRVLAGFIDATRRDLIALRPHDIQERFIPTASDELDAIVQATETATEDIMDCMEGLEDLTARLAPEDAEVLTAATTRIYEACTFQDITGQRITKVVRTLKSIEERIDAMVATFSGAPGMEGAVPGSEAPASDDLNRFRTAAAARGDRPEDMDLLNGPQKSGEAMNQTDIDALLND